MSTIGGAAPVHSALDENAWDGLLTFTEDKRVIPIVGPELLEVDTPEGPRLLHDWLAEELDVRPGLDIRTLPSPFTLDEVVSSFGASRGRREEAYVRLRPILKEADFTPSPALRRRASITDFNAAAHG